MPQSVRLFLMVVVFALLGGAAGGATYNAFSTKSITKLEQKLEEQKLEHTKALREINNTLEIEIAKTQSPQKKKLANLESRATYLQKINELLLKLAEAEKNKSELELETTRNQLSEEIIKELNALRDLMKKAESQ